MLYGKIIKRFYIIFKKTEMKLDSLKPVNTSMCTLDRGNMFRKNTYIEAGTHFLPIFSHTLRNDSANFDLYTVLCFLPPKVPTPRED